VGLRSATPGQLGAGTPGCGVGQVCSFAHPNIVLGSRAVGESGLRERHRFVVLLCVLLSSTQAGVEKTLFSRKERDYETRRYPKMKF
jgi:hypothetical protein